MRMPIGLPAMPWMIRLGPLAPHTDPDLALYGRYVLPQRLLDEGFDFRFPQIDEALIDLVRSNSVRNDAPRLSSGRETVSSRT